MGNSRYRAQYSESSGGVFGGVRGEKSPVVSLVSGILVNGFEETSHTSESEAGSCLERWGVGGSHESKRVTSA